MVAVNEFESFDQKNLIGHALPPTTGIARYRRDLAILPLNSSLGKVVAQAPLLFTAPRNPAPDRTWNQVPNNFSTVLRGSENLIGQTLPPT